MMMMMGRNQNQNQNENQRGSSASTSRLSASAKPFTMNNPQPILKFSSSAPQAFDPSLDLWNPISSSVSGFQQLSLLNLEEDDLTLGAYDYHGYSLEVGLEPYYPQHLSEGFQDHSDFDMRFGSLTISEASRPLHAPNQQSIGLGELGNDQGSFCWIEENDNGLMPSEALPKQAFSMKELCFTPSPESKGKDKVIGKPISSEPLSPLKVATTVPRITSDDFSLKHHDVEVCDNDADLDLDSPCWKGTRNSIKSPFGVPQPVNSHQGENEVEAHNSLNPMAPHFFPCYGRPSVCQTRFIEDDITSFQNSPISAEDLKSRQNEVQTGSGSLKKEVCTQSSDDVLELNGGNELLNISNFGSVLNSSHMATARPYVVEDYFTSKVASEEAVASSLKGVKEGATQVSTLVSFTAGECMPSSSLSGVDVPKNITKTFQDVPNSLYRSSGIEEGHMLVNAMSHLSELLVQNFSNDFEPLDELDHDAIRHIINKLYLCIQNRDGQRTLLPKSTCPEISYCLKESTDLQKVQVTRAKAVSFSHGKGDENHKLQVLGSCSGYRIEEEDRMSKVGEEEVHPQTLLYRKLWLEAEAALCAMKYKAHLFHMKDEMGHC